MLHSLLSKLTRCLRTLFRLVVHKKGKRRIKKNGIVLFGSHHIFQIGLRQCFTSSVKSLMYFATKGLIKNKLMINKCDKLSWGFFLIAKYV